MATIYLPYPKQDYVLMSDLPDGGPGEKLLSYTDPALIVPGEVYTPPVLDDLGDERIYQFIYSHEWYPVAPPFSFYFHYHTISPDEWGNMDINNLQGFSYEATDYDPLIWPSYWESFSGFLSHTLVVPYTYDTEVQSLGPLDPLKPEMDEVCNVPVYGSFGGGTLEAGEDYSGENIEGCYMRASIRKYFWLWQFQPCDGGIVPIVIPSLLHFLKFMGIELCGGKGGGEQP
jgi:hypothetical protein